MKRILTWTLVSLMSVFLISCFSLTGCKKVTVTETTAAETTAAAATTTAAETTKGKELTFVFIPKLIGHPYFTRTEVGFKEAEKDFPIKVIHDGPAAEDANKQISLIEDYVNKKVDAIFISPTSGDAVVPVIQKALDAGVKVFTYDMDAANSARIWCITGCGDPEFSIFIAEALAKAINNKGEVAFLTGGVGSEILNKRLATVKSVLEKSPDIKIVGTETDEEDLDKGTAKVKSLLQMYPNLAGIFGASSQNPLEAAIAVSEAGKSGKIQIFGLGLPSQCKKYVKDGTIQGLALLDPAQMAYVACAIGYKYITNNGELPTPGVDYGKFGGKPVIKVDTKQAFVDTYIFTPENVDNFQF